MGEGDVVLDGAETGLGGGVSADPCTRARIESSSEEEAMITGRGRRGRGGQKNRGGSQAGYVEM